MDEKMKKTIMYLGLGGLAVWYFFLRKKKGTEEEMSNFFSKKARRKIRGRIRKVKGKIKRHIKKGGLGGMMHRKLKKRKRSLISKLRGSRAGRGIARVVSRGGNRAGRGIARVVSRGGNRVRSRGMFGRVRGLRRKRRGLIRKIRRGGFFGGGMF
jgi:hypothetical protein